MQVAIRGVKGKMHSGIPVPSPSGGPQRMARKRHETTTNSGEITEMVNLSGSGKYPPLTALQRHETMLGC
jgi:hypothetical protein